jgi:hypothetical protein
VAIMLRAFEAIVTIITALKGPDCHHSGSINGARRGRAGEFACL